MDIIFTIFVNKPMIESYNKHFIFLQNDILSKMSLSSVNQAEKKNVTELKN